MSAGGDGPAWDVAEALRLRRAGWSEERLARHFGVPLWKVRSRLLMAEAYGVGLARQTRRRACLRCRRAFDSEGAGNRICEVCRQSKDWAAGPWDHGALAGRSGR